ncbi:hypothetical protein DL98DRAFT_149633 [Cadophora sp. DSE1049]|nr:hypothetical protein DL98DRAFT_149633 [Cadophora sp. DSE1049]
MNRDKIYYLLFFSIIIEIIRLLLVRIKRALEVRCSKDLSYFHPPFEQVNQTNENQVSARNFEDYCYLPFKHNGNGTVPTIVKIYFQSHREVLLSHHFSVSLSDGASLPTNMRTLPSMG